MQNFATTMQHLIIYRAQPSDIGLVRQIGIETYAPYYSHIWHPGGVEWYIEQCFGHETLERELHDNSIHYYLPQTSEGNTVGLLKIHPDYPIPSGSGSDAMYLEKIYLMPAFFRTGMGQTLLRHTEEMAISLQKQAIWLQVMQSGPVAAYAKSGYQIEGATRFDFELLKEEERDGWVMVKPLIKSFF